MHSSELRVGCEKGSPALAPHFPCCAFWPHLVQSATGGVGKLLLKKKYNHVCLFWWFSFAFNQWAGPTHRAAACLLDPTGMVVGKGEQNCPSGSSQHFRRLQDRRMQPPCLVGRARGPASEGQPPRGSQALAGLGLQSSWESYPLWLIPEVPFDFGGNIYWTCLLD